jgi:hypothetical protein
MLTNNPKANTLNSIMNDQKLLGIIKEGLAAPLGSTKRKQARSMLTVSNKVRNTFYNGQGGAPGSVTNLLQPAGMANQMSTTYNPQQTAPALSITQKPTTSNQKLTVQQPQTNNQPLAVAPVAPQKRDIAVGLPLPKTSSEVAQNNVVGDSTTTPATTLNLTPPSTVTTTNEIVPPYGNNAEGLLKWYQENPTDFQQYTNKVLNISTPLGNSERPADVPSAMWDEITKAVENKIGKETWTYQALPKLKEWFKNQVPEEELPVGVYWTDDLSRLQKSLKEEYGLDEKLSNLQTLQTEGYTIKDDLQSYIRGRDKYITNIDSMIDNVNNLYVTSDVSDPIVRGLLDKYRNYLYISKGRQSMKYDQYVKTSIAEFESKQKRLTDEYNNSLSNYKTAYSEEKEVTKDRFNYYKGMLENLYNNLEEQSETNNDILKTEIDKLDNIQKIIGYTVEAGGGTILTNAQTSDSQQNYIRMHPGEGDKAIDDWNKLSSTDKLRWSDSNTPKIALQEYLDSNATLTDNEKSKIIRSFGFKPSDFGLVESLDLNSLINL